MIEYQKLEKSQAVNQSPYNRRLNKTAEYELTIVIPVFNEEDNIFALEQKLSAFVSQSWLAACVLLVNDGSTDHSKERIMEVCKRQKHLYYLNLAKNSGLSAALKAGIDATWSTYMGYIDADLQTTPEDFNLLIPYMEDFEMVLGIRTVREDSFVKKSLKIIGNNKASIILSPIIIPANAIPI